LLQITVGPTTGEHSQSQGGNSDKNQSTTVHLLLRTMGIIRENTNPANKRAI